MILNSAVDRPWSQYFCCLLSGSADFVDQHPIATKHVSRDSQGHRPVRRRAGGVARMLVDGGFTERYDYALQALTEVPYDRWREFDPEDTLRFYALRLYEAGMIHASPNRIIADGADWRFLNEIKRELKAEQASIAETVVRILAEMPRFPGQRILGGGRWRPWCPTGARRRGAAGGDHDPAPQELGHLRCP